MKIAIPLTFQVLGASNRKICGAHVQWYTPLLDFCSPAQLLKSFGYTFLIFTHLLGFVYGSTGLPPVPVDDYLDRLKAAIGTKDPGDLAYLDLRKIPADSAQLLPFKKRYIFLNGESVVECTLETLLKEYILGDRGLAELRSYKIADIAGAFAEQKISVRGIKLLMAHWLDNQSYRFVRGGGCSHAISEQRERAKASMVFGLYERGSFLNSCKPTPLGVDYLDLAALLLVEVLLGKKPEISAAGAASVPMTSPVVSNKDTEIEERRRAKRAEVRKNYRKRLSAKLAAAKLAAAKLAAAVATTDDDQDLEDDVRVVAAVEDAVAASEGKDDAIVVVSALQPDALAMLETAQLPTQGRGDGLAPRLDPRALAEGEGSLVDASSTLRTPPRSPTKTPPSTPPRSPPRSPARTPPPPSEPWNIAWGGGVEAEYEDVLNQREHRSLKRKFKDLKSIITTEGMGGLRGLIQKMESKDDVFSYRLNDKLRAVFTVDSESKSIIFLRGIKHYKGSF